MSRFVGKDGSLKCLSISPVNAWSLLLLLNERTTRFCSNMMQWRCRSQWHPMWHNARLAKLWVWEWKLLLLFILYYYSRSWREILVFHNLVVTEPSSRANCGRVEHLNYIALMLRVVTDDDKICNRKIIVLSSFQQICIYNHVTNK